MLLKELEKQENGKEIYLFTDDKCTFQFHEQRGFEKIGEEINALKNVKSLTFRLFTDKEDACNHCNCGNSKLVFDTFMN